MHFVLTVPIVNKYLSNTFIPFNEPKCGERTAKLIRVNVDFPELKTYIGTENVNERQKS